MYLVNSSTIIAYGEWNNAGFEFMAQKYLADANFDPEGFADVRLKDFMLHQPEKVITVMIEMYDDTVEERHAYNHHTGHFIYVSPQLFETFCRTYRIIYVKRKIILEEHRERFARGFNGI